MTNNPKKTDAAKTTPLWETPMIKPHRHGFLNKFGRLNLARDYEDHAFGVPVSDLVRDYGSPLFVTSESRIRENVRALKQAFSSRYPYVLHGWSYKTHYNSAVCQIFHQEGSWAEVVSGFEYDKARQLGVPGCRILFNGPAKRRADLEKAITEGAHIHVDNFDELYLIDNIATQYQKRVPLTLRLNFDTGYTEAWSRFGFNLESGQAREAAYFIANSELLYLSGLHSHIGTFILDPRAYEAQVRLMCQFMRDMEQETHCRIDSIDIGGGLPSRNALQGVYLPPEQIVPELERYAEAICNTLMEETRYREQESRTRPTLVLESGRAMVDDAQVLLSSVLANKTLADGRRSLVLDAGVNLLFTSYWYNHGVKLTRAIAGQREETVLYGPLCMNIDVLRHNVSLPPLTSDEVLMFTHTGAYNNTQWMQFIEYRPAVVLVRDDSRVDLIRERENLDSMQAQERLPADLQRYDPAPLLLDDDTAVTILDPVTTQDIDHPLSGHHQPQQPAMSRHHDR